MPSPEALLDSNVVVAALAEEHQHHAPSLAILQTAAAEALAVAAHSYAEAFVTLTRRGERRTFHRTPDQAWAALESVAAVTRLVGLTPSQTFDAVRAYAAAGGVGARVYDHLIGQAAVIAGAPTIVTWNTGRLRSLFPALRVVTPEEYPARTRSN